MLGEEKERTYFKDSLSKNFCVVIPESFEHICSFSWLREEWIWLGHKNPAWFLGLSCNWKFVWKWRSLQHLCVPQEQELLSGFLRGLSWRPVILREWECRENLASENPQTEDRSHCCWGHLQAPGREGEEKSIKEEAKKAFFWAWCQVFYASHPTLQMLKLRFQQINCKVIGGAWIYTEFYCLWSWHWGLSPPCLVKTHTGKKAVAVMWWEPWLYGLHS